MGPRTAPLDDVVLGVHCDPLQLWVVPFAIGSENIFLNLQAILSLSL